MRSQLQILAPFQLYVHIYIYKRMPYKPKPNAPELRAYNLPRRWNSTKTCWPMRFDHRLQGGGLRKIRTCPPTTLTRTNLHPLQHLRVEELLSLNPKPYACTGRLHWVPYVSLGWCPTRIPYLEGQGDLVRGSKTPIARIVTLIIPINNPLTKPP